MPPVETFTIHTHNTERGNRKTADEIAKELTAVNEDILRRRGSILMNAVLDSPIRPGMNPAPTIFITADIPEV